MDKLTDLLVIGGGINGVAIAADAAGRGLSVVLCERDDLANHTSSCSTKLIHGGLRYLENLEFKLVRESLTEREILMQSAPHLVQPIEMVLPHHAYSRSKWLLSVGLFLYDHMGVRHSLPKSHKLKLADLPDNPLQPSLAVGYSFSDCQSDDSRLTLTVALRAQQKGAHILPRHQVMHAYRDHKRWTVIVRDTVKGGDKTFYPKVLVNVAGPWAGIIQSDIIKQPSKHRIVLVKGSHMVFPKLYQGKQAYLLQHLDKRVIFVIPYLDDFSLIGTTDVPYQGDPAQASISNEEKQYLCEVVNTYFNRKITPQQAVWAYSGVRPLIAKPGEKVATISRDYGMELSCGQGQAALLSVFGGKLTTHRHLAEVAVQKLKKIFKDLKPNWTATAVLPGGDLKAPTFAHFKQQLWRGYPWLPEPLVKRLVCAYGTRCYDLLGDTSTLQQMGLHFGASLYEQEVKFLMATEWARSADDILWRRTKQGIYFDDAQFEKLQNWINLYLKDSDL